MNYNSTIIHNQRNIEEINREKISTVALNKQTKKIYFQVIYPLLWGNTVAQWLRYCATNQKVAGSIPDGVNGIFH
jgi:hypothetical protein